MALTGDFRYTLGINNLAEVFDKGTTNKTKTFVGNIRAARTKAKEVENFGNDRSNTNNLLSFRVRYRSDISQSTIVTYDNLDYEVLSLEPIGIKDLLILNLRAVK